MTYAVNASDLAVAPLVLRALLAPHVAGRRFVEAQPDQWAGSALVLECDADQARAIVEVVRLKLRRGQFRFYCREHGAWRQV